MQENQETVEEREMEITQEETQERSDQENRLTKNQKQRIISILFGRLLNMHKYVMIVFTVVHSIIIVLTCVHMFTLGTIESENTSCYLTWPLMHLFYAFVNYIFAWFYCYNSCEIMSKRGQSVLIVSKKFLKVLFIFSFTPAPLKMLSSHFCRNWTISWDAVIKQNLHILIECILVFVYFTWFERKYTGFRIFYKESIY